MATNLNEEYITKIISSFTDLLKKQIEGDVELNKTLRELQSYMGNMVKSDEFKEKINIMAKDISRLERSINNLAEDFYDLTKVLQDNTSQLAIEELKAKTEIHKATIASVSENNIANKTFWKESTKAIIAVIGSIFVAVISVLATKQALQEDAPKETKKVEINEVQK